MSLSIIALISGIVLAFMLPSLLYRQMGERLPALLPAEVRR
jgi:hypothetical protein